MNPVNSSEDIKPPLGLNGVLKVPAHPSGNMASFTKHICAICGDRSSGRPVAAGPRGAGGRGQEPGQPTRGSAGTSTGSRLVFRPGVRSTEGGWPGARGEEQLTAVPAEGVTQVTLWTEVPAHQSPVPAAPRKDHCAQHGARPRPAGGAAGGAPPGPGAGGGGGGCGPGKLTRRPRPQASTTACTAVRAARASSSARCART